MNRTFHSKVRFDQIIYLIILTAVCCYMIWIKQAIVATILGLMIIMVIERIINTEYTLTTDNKLLIKKGRYSKLKTIPLDDMLDIEIKTTTRFWSHFLLRYVLITLKNNTYVGVTPNNVDDFYKALIRRKENYNH